MVRPGLVLTHLVGPLLSYPIEWVIGTDGIAVWSYFLAVAEALFRLPQLAMAPLAKSPEIRRCKSEVRPHSPVYDMVYLSRVRVNSALAEKGAADAVAFRPLAAVEVSGKDALA